MRLLKIISNSITKLISVSHVILSDLFFLPHHFVLFSFLSTLLQSEPLKAIRWQHKLYLSLSIDSRVKWNILARWQRPMQDPTGPRRPCGTRKWPYKVFDDPAQNAFRKPIGQGFLRCYNEMICFSEEKISKQDEST